MALPIAAIGAGLTAGGIAGTLFGKKSVPKFDPAFANRLADVGRSRETGFIDQFKTGTTGASDQFRTDINDATASAQLQSRQGAQEFLENFDPITSRLVKSRQDALKQSLFGEIPELVQAAREAGAAGGGLDRGVIQSNLANIPIQQGQAFNRGATELGNTALQAQLDARTKVFDANNQLILNKLGIDSNTAEAILNSGNQALVNELNALIDSSRNAIGIQISADSAAQGSNIGNVQDINANRQAIFNGLIGGGTALLGSGQTSAGTPVTSNRSVIQDTTERLSPQPIRSA